MTMLENTTLPPLFYFTALPPIYAVMAVMAVKYIFNYGLTVNFTVILR